MTGALGVARGLASPQSLQNLPSALGVAATQRGRRSKPDKSTLGLTMWFRVTVADADVNEAGEQSLGDWSSCSGLSVKFNTEPLDEGGDYDSPWLMPTKITYGEVTLERAIDKANAGEIEDWLGQVATQWMKGDAGGAKEIARSSSSGESSGSNVSTTIDIELHSSLAPKKDGDDHVVHHWELRDAIPVAYTGPNLSSKGSEVATEKLVIAHRGIARITAADSANGGQETSNQGELTLSRLEEPDKGDIVFPFNPKALQLQKTVTFAKSTTVGQPIEQQVTDAGALSVTIDGLRLEGVTEVEKVTKLMAWLDPIPPPEGSTTTPAPAQKVTGAKPGAGKKSPAATTEGADAEGTNPEEDAAADQSPKGKPKELVVKLGSGLNFKVLLKAVTAKYTRFTKTGMASRADVNLTLQVNEGPPHLTNPTSGGRPGGKIHTTVTGDTLPGIATATYGTPSAWRDIAEANGIDDPMRLPSGRSLYLAGR